MKANDGRIKHGHRRRFHGSGSLCGKAIGSRRSSTLGFERLYNGALKKKPEEQWVHDLLKDMPLSPPYFKRMKKVNKPAELRPCANLLALAENDDQSARF